MNVKTANANIQEAEKQSVSINNSGASITNNCEQKHSNLQIVSEADGNLTYTNYSVIISK
jgi:hypothetical protein